MTLTTHGDLAMLRRDIADLYASYPSVDGVVCDVEFINTVFAYQIALSARATALGVEARRLERRFKTRARVQRVIELRSIIARCDSDRRSWHSAAVRHSNGRHSMGFRHVEVRAAA